MRTGTPSGKLTDVRLRTLRSEERPTRHWDGGGLYLEVRPTGARLWRYRYRIAGRERLMALGEYPEVSLSRARELHAAARLQVADGVDPVRARKMAGAVGTTFRAVAEEWLADHAGVEVSAGTVDRNRRRLALHALPLIGDVQVARLSPLDVLGVLRPLQQRGKIEMAHRVRVLVGQVLRYAVATARAERDVTVDVRGALPAPDERHHATILEPAKVGALLRALDGYDGGVLVRAALRLTPLVFVRPGELRAAEWSEFHGDTWMIPAERMKMRAAHVVPLSSQALAIVGHLRRFTGGGRFLFPSPRSSDRPISNNTVNAALRTLGYGHDDITAHGFRAMARTILDETLRFPPHLIEHQLAHQVRDPLGRAYNRTSHLDERRAMMQVWADHLDELRRVALPSGDEGRHELPDVVVRPTGQPRLSDGV